MGVLLRADGADILLHVHVHCLDVPSHRRDILEVGAALGAGFSGGVAPVNLDSVQTQVLLRVEGALADVAGVLARGVPYFYHTC